MIISIRKKGIDIVICSFIIIDFAGRCQLTEFNEVLINDNRGYLLDIAIEQHCSCKMNEHDRPNRVKLNNNRKSHVIKINEKLEQSKVPIRSSK